MRSLDQAITDANAAAPGELALDGLDGGHPLGFMAALGTLRTAASLAAGPPGEDGDVRMRWQRRAGAWRPSLRIGAGHVADTAVVPDVAGWVETLHHRLSASARHAAFDIANDLTLPVGEFRAHCREAVTRAGPQDRHRLDLLAAFGSDLIEAREAGKPSGKMADTAFRTMSGAGHQHFLGFMRVLARDVGPDHLHRTLFAPWRYSDPLESHTLRWDPMDDVRYALRARDSSGDPQRRRSGAMWGANRLAIEALALLPTMPVHSTALETTGFTRLNRPAAEGRSQTQAAQTPADPNTGYDEGMAWTWPIWEGWCGVDTVRSLLALPELRRARPDRPRLQRQGVVEVFRCLRITQGKYRNFTPALPA